MLKDEDFEKADIKVHKMFATVVAAWLAAAVVVFGVVGTAIFLLVRHFGKA
jgi:hypothetical protein